MGLVYVRGLLHFRREETSRMTRSLVYLEAWPRRFNSAILLAICLGMSLAAQTRQTLSVSFEQNGRGRFALRNTTATIDATSAQTLKMTIAGVANVTTQLWTVEAIN